MESQERQHSITIGVLALQGAFSEHLQLLRRAFITLGLESGGQKTDWRCIEVRTAEQLQQVDGLIIPGGESTTIAIIAARSGLLDPLRTFVKTQRKSVWGTCAGMILLAEAANRTKQTGQDLIGGLDVRVNRNHFGRQTESFEADIEMPFLNPDEESGLENHAFRAVFIRAPIVERILPPKTGIQDAEEAKPDTIVAPSRTPEDNVASWTINSEVEVLATLPDRHSKSKQSSDVERSHEEDVVAVRQGNVVATSFHPELTNDARIHVWWLKQVRAAVHGEGHPDA